MKKVLIEVGDDDVKDLKRIFSNENSFEPKAREDYLIINILKQVVQNLEDENSYNVTEE